ESQAKNRYTFFAKVAQGEGYEQIAALFMETAMHEEMHAKRFFSFFEGGMVEITASYPAGVISTTAENLKAAAEGEHEEWSHLYPDFAEVAEAEGFKSIAVLFRSIAKVEAEHERRYLKLLGNVNSGKVFEREAKVKWVCRKCGFIHESTKALVNCPACNHPRAYFEIHAENY
ncbi:MAG TPA: rubrerythrin family protein, partial [Bacteroidales bacterium]|nr:rubrerythrin family protein [Bacteroidales bacterium]